MITNSVLAASPRSGDKWICFWDHRGDRPHAALQISDARHGVSASGCAYSPAPFPLFQLSTSPGRQHESLPAEVTGQRQGLKYHRSGERADDRLAEVMRGRSRFETIPSLWEEDWPQPLPCWNSKPWTAAPQTEGSTLRTAHVLCRTSQIQRTKQNLPATSVYLNVMWMLQRNTFSSL